MGKTEHPSFTYTPILRWIVFLLLSSTTLVITVNSFDSGIAKTPLIVLLASLLAVVYFSMAVWSGELRFRPSRADLPVLMFLILIVASTLYSEFPRNSLQALELWIPFIICFFAGTQVFWNQDAVRKLMWALALIASVVLLIGMIQFFFSSALLLDFFIGDDRRVTSTLTNATYLSGYIILLFPVLLAFALSEPKRTWTRLFLLALLCGLAFLLFITSTRSSVVGFFVSLLVVGMLLKGVRGKAIAWGTGALLLVALGVWFTPHLAERVEASFHNDPTSTFARRMYFWQAGYNAWKTAPFFGHGIGSYEEVMLEYRSPEYWVVKSEDIVPHAHNDIIETAVDLGGVGVAIYLSILGVVFLFGLRAGPNEKKRDKLVRAGLLCSLLAILIDNLTNVSLRIVPVGATTWLLLGVLASHVSTSMKVKVITIRTTRWLVLFPLGVWVVFTLFYFSYQWPRFVADNHMIKGSLAYAAQRIPEAISEYRLAASLDPHNLLARSSLALMFLEVGSNAEALQTEHQLQEQSPHYPKSNLVQAAALISLRRYPEALDRVERELTLRDHPEAYFYQAAAYMGIGDSTKEIRSLEHLLLADIKGKLNFELDRVSRRLALLTTKEEDLRRLVGVYRQLSEAFPSDTTVASTLAVFDSRLTELSRGSPLP